MIEPKQSGAALLADINATQLMPGQVAIWWLGQSGYAIKTAHHLVYIDLYLSEHLTSKYAHTEKPHIRMTSAPLRGDEITNAQWVFASHKHSDHLDPGTVPALFTASPQAKLILPAALIDHAASLGLATERLIPTRGDETLILDGLTIHSIPSAHPDLDYSAESGYPFLGYVLELDGLTLYHSGDSIIYEGMAERLRRFDLDIAFLPINGTDARRKQLKVPPNMNAQDAIALAKAIRSRLMIPHHYDMFTFNTFDVANFITQAQIAELPFQVLQPGARFVWQRS